MVGDMIAILQMEGVQRWRALAVPQQVVVVAVKRGAWGAGWGALVLLLPRGRAARIVVSRKSVWIGRVRTLKSL